MKQIVHDKREVLHDTIDKVKATVSRLRWCLRQKTYYARWGWGCWCSRLHQFIEFASLCSNAPLPASLNVLTARRGVRTIFVLRKHPIILNSLSSSSRKYPTLLECAPAARTTRLKFHTMRPAERPADRERPDLETGNDKTKTQRYIGLYSLHNLLQ